MSKEGKEWMGDVASIHRDKRRFEREFGTERELLAQTIRDVNAFRSTIVGGNL